MAKIRNERLELKLTEREKSVILAMAKALKLSANEFVVRATIKEMKRLKIKLKRPQVDLFNQSNKQLDLDL